ncbi:MAG: sporulation protein YqfD [Clostridia bacterium]|nr:sporulation protein YqfD [Clostridia bacterium]
MFLKILIGFLIGYVRLTIEGYYIERFINLCTTNKITIWNLKRDKNVKLDLNVRIKDFKEIVRIAKKTKCKVKIKSKKGFPFLLHRYKKRKIFALLLMIIMGLVLFTSNFVWNIDIKEENGKELENIIQDLNEVGLVTGEWKSKINTKDIINKIRLKRNDIAWMGIELKGTNVIVKVKKADEKPSIVDEKEYCNIVSNKNGVITKINAQNGTANVKVGDIVNEGTVLISGWMEGKYTGLNYVHAKGEIQAKVWYTKSTKIEYNQIIKEETGKIEKKYSLKLNNFKINFKKGVSKFKFYDTITSEKKFKIFSDFYLPISIEEITYKELEEKQKKYTPEEAKNIGIKELQQQLDNEIEDKENIVNKNINAYEHENYVEVFVTYEVLEDIGTEEKI